MVQRQPAQGHPTFPAPPAAGRPAPPPPAPPRDKRDKPAAPVTGQFLMRTGRTYEEQANIHQAIYVYYQMIDRYPDSREAQESYERLLRIARDYEEQGQLYQAKHLYTRIEDAIEGTDIVP
ncbi:MAG: tol-pal system YbgF family protein [Dehalococcoidia bacterium]